jgi:hypothetical protein
VKLKCGVAAAIITVAVSVAWPTLDKRGWIPHRQVTRVFSLVDQPWAIGEYLDCVADPHVLLSRTAPTALSGILSLECLHD